MPKILDTQDGSNTLLCHNFDVTYHSKYGAIDESTHVFINEGLLPLVNQGKRKFYIVEYGLGTGLNCLLTVLKAQELGLTIHYIGLELYPVSKEMYQNLNYSKQLNVDKDLMMSIHTSEWGEEFQLSDGFTFVKHKIDFKDFHSKVSANLVYYDAFGPSTQPELWDQEMVERIKGNMKKDGLFTTYCAKGSFKRALKAAEFEVIPRPGPTGKREITTARLR